MEAEKTTSMGREILSKRSKTVAGYLPNDTIILLDNHHFVVYPWQSDSVAHDCNVIKIDSGVDRFLPKRKTPTNAKINHTIPHL